MCKWLKILLNSFSQHPGEHFKLFRSILALKLTELQAFEISNIFGSLLFGRRPKNIEEILSNGCRKARFSLENLKKVTFRPKNLFFKVIKQIKVLFWSANLVLKLKEMIFGLKSSFKYLIFGLESSFKYCCENLKWLLIKSFEHLNQTKQAGRVNNVGHVGHFGHADPVGHADLDHVQHVDHVQHDNHVQHFDHIQHVDHVQHQHFNHVQHVDHVQHVNHVHHVNHAQHQLVDHIQHIKHGQHFELVHHMEDALPTGKKDNNNQIIPFLKFFFIFTLSFLRVSSRTLRKLEMFKLFHYIFMHALKAESGVYCRFMKYVLKMVRAIKSGGAAQSLINWVVLEKKMCEVVCVVGWIWRMVTKKSSDWLNVLKVLSTHPSSQAHHTCQKHH